MKIHLITYGDDQYSFQRENFRKSALASGFFDDITVYNPNDLDQDFTFRFQHILQHRKGGGYWIWKPYFIKKALSNIADGDILIYCDAGCMINSNGRLRFLEYIEQLVLSDIGIITFQLPFIEYEYTKEEIFRYFKVPQEIVNSNHRMATVILMKKCNHAILSIDKWLNTLYDFPELFTDQLKLQQHKFFKESRHDQSVFSVVTKICGAITIPDETYFKDFKNEGLKFPFWAMRLK